MPCGEFPLPNSHVGPNGYIGKVTITQIDIPMDVSTVTFRPIPTWWLRPGIVPLPMHGLDVDHPTARLIP